jgi:hypothetical protein
MRDASAHVTGVSAELAQVPARPVGDDVAFGGGHDIPCLEMVPVCQRDPVGCLRGSRCPPSPAHLQSNLTSTAPVLLAGSDPREDDQPRPDASWGSGDVDRRPLSSRVDRLSYPGSRQHHPLGPPASTGGRHLGSIPQP